MEDFLVGLTPTAQHRFTANHVIDLDGERAVCHSSILVLDGGAIASSGRTVDGSSASTAAWKFARRTYTADARPSTDA